MNPKIRKAKNTEAV